MLTRTPCTGVKVRPASPEDHTKLLTYARPQGPLESAWKDEYNAMPPMQQNADGTVTITCWGDTGREAPAHVRRFLNGEAIVAEIVDVERTR